MQNVLAACNLDSYEAIPNAYLPSVNTPYDFQKGFAVLFFANYVFSTWLILAVTSSSYHFILLGPDIDGRDLMVAIMHSVLKVKRCEL